jgi:hypothetical protein
LPKTKFSHDPDLIIDGHREPTFHGPILPRWSAAARKKGFSIAARVADRFHLALRCDVCAGLTKTKLFVLMNNRPACAPCLLGKQMAMARMAGLTMLGRDLSNRHYALYMTPCGHEQRRQFAFVAQISRGEKALRCDVCLDAKHAAAAAEQGWTLRGADPEGRVAYRLYRHNACGIKQSVTIGNMQTGRFTCSGCGECWTTAPSTIYLMRFKLSDGDPVIKLGFARNPVSRLNHQLQSGLTRTGALLRIVPLPTGRAALNAEQGLHRRIKAALPQAIVPHARFDGQIKVRSEIYTPEALPLMTSLLDDLAARLAA